MGSIHCKNTKEAKEAFRSARFGFKEEMMKVMKTSKIVVFQTLKNGQYTINKYSCWKKTKTVTVCLTTFSPMIWVMGAFRCTCCQNL